MQSDATEQYTQEIRDKTTHELRFLLHDLTQNIRIESVTVANTLQKKKIVKTELQNRTGGQHHEG